MEQRIGRKLEIVSGSATSSFTLVHWGHHAAGVNHLRIEEGHPAGQGLLRWIGASATWTICMDALTLPLPRWWRRVKDSLSRRGEFAIDAFGP